LQNIHHILKQYWHYDQFRPLQEEIIQSVLDTKDTLALLPTGGGKSVCFQVPAMAMEGICIVITPLIALMKDQVRQLKKRGISAVAVYSGMSKREIDITLDNCVYGEIKFLYLSPERLETELFQVRLKKMKVCLIAVDEAHCISQWGYDFRPSYLEIPAFRNLLPGIPTIALTASATEDVAKDIIEKLALNAAAVFKKSYERKNISYSCFYQEDKESKLLEILKNVNGSSIVYTRSRKQCMKLSELLNKRKFKADYYHAGLTNKEREEKQERWTSGLLRIIVSTNAFGMGIDKPDVRTVIHFDLPENLESYYQEAGRAGRDEQKAYAVLLYNEHDIEQLKEKVSQAYPPVVLIRKVYQCLANFFKIAVGSSNLASFDFDIIEFEKVYELPKMETYYALKRLESEGFIQMNEAFYTPSKVIFNVDNQRLYEFQISEPNFDPMIKVLLRMYGGEIFTNYTTIVENNISKNLNISTKEAVNMLLHLNKLNLLTYEQQKDKPQVIFITPRQDASVLPLDVKKIELRKKNDTKKCEEMIFYVKQQERCRSIILLEYFGESGAKDCGVCDICLQKKKEKVLSENYKKYHDSILKAIREGVTDINKLVQSIDIKNKQAIIPVISEMVDSGEIKYDQYGHLQMGITDF
jgi:ATP-dependent DNA helicase RecQ